MYYSIVERTGTGSLQLVPVPPYLQKSHITLFVNGAPSLIYEWVNDDTISLVAPVGQLIRVVRRSSPGLLLTDYHNGTSLPGEVLDLDSKQAFYLAQEAYDLAILGGTVAGNTAGTSGGIELTTGGLLALLSGQITAVQLEGSLAAQVGLINAPSSTVGSLAWYLNQEAVTRTSALSAETAARVAALETEAMNRDAAITVEREARQAADVSLAEQVTTLTAHVNTNTAAVQTAVSVLATDLETQAELLTTLTSTVGDVSAAVTDEALTRANDIEALAATVDEVWAAIEDIDGGVSAGVVESVNALATRTGVVEANYSLKTIARTDSLKAVAGIGLLSSTTGDIAQSQIIFQADKFVWVPGSDINAVPQPLLEIGQVNGVNTFVFPSTQVGDRTLGARMFVDGSIETRMLKVVGGSGASLWTDTNFEDTAAWEVADWGTKPSQQVITDGVSGGTTMRSGTTQQSARGIYRVPVSSAKRYRVSAYVRRSSTANGTFYLRLHAGNTKTSTLYQQVTLGGALEGHGPGTTWARVKAEWVPPTGTTFASPMVLLNYGGSAGWMEAQDIRIEEMLESSLVVQEGIDADRINTRGLTIKDALGNVIFGSGQNLDMSRIAGIGAFASINQITGTNAATYIQAGAITNAFIGNVIQSDDFATGTTGWRIKKDGGIECRNIVARGDIQATSLNAATGTFAGSLSAATGTFSGTLTATAVDAVDTINLKGNAVTIPVSFEWSGSFAYTGYSHPNPWVGGTPSTDFKGGTVTVICYAEGAAYGLADESVGAAVYKNGVLFRTFYMGTATLTSSGRTAYAAGCFMFQDTPVGPTTYQIGSPPLYGYAGSSDYKRLAIAAIGTIR